MQKDNFLELLRVLNVELVVFIDDDFTPKTQLEEQLIHFCNLQDAEFDYAISELQKIEQVDIAQYLLKFKQDFIKLEFTEQDNEWLKAGAIVRMLESKGETNLVAAAKEVIVQLSKADDFVQELSLNLGLANPLENYNELLEIARSSTSVKSVRLFKNLEGKTFNDFADYATKMISDASGKMMLAVVDKVLGGKDTGHEIIKGFRQIPGFKKQMLSVIYTSNESDLRSNSSGLDKYFDVQILKDKSSIDSIAHSIAICAFVLMLEKIIEIRKEALEETQKLVATEGVSNIVYIASMAHIEGITSHYAIDQWVEHFSNKVAADKLYIPPSDYRLICGLAGLLNEDFFPEPSKPSGIFAKHLNELSAFELFNNHINAFHSPPGPGDIFEINGQLYVLAGQECDLIVRGQGGGTVERKEKIAEIVKATFDPRQLHTKFQPDGKDSEGIKVNYFNYSGDKGNLHIHFNQRESIDFRVLDLCSLNERGNAICDLEFPVAQHILDVMPRMWNQYSKTLVNDLKKKLYLSQIVEWAGVNPIVLEGDISFSLKVDIADNIVTYPIKRIARLKSQIKDVFLQRYFQYRTRKGTNSILLHNQKDIKCKSLKAGFAHNISECNPHPETIVALLSNDREKNKDIAKLSIVLNVESIGSYIDPIHLEVLNRVANEQLTFSENTFQEEQSQIKFKKKFDKEAELELEMLFPYYNDYLTRYFHPTKNNLFSFNEIFGEDISLSGINDYEVDGGNKPWKKVDKMLFVSFEDLSKEITIDGIGKAKLNRDNGVINVILTPKSSDTKKGNE